MLFFDRMIQVSGEKSIFPSFFCSLFDHKKKQDQIFWCVFSHKSAEIDELQVLEHTVVVLICFIFFWGVSYPMATIVSMILKDLITPMALGLPNPKKNNVGFTFFL